MTDLTTCPMCQRKHRGPGLYCGHRCASRAVTPEGQDLDHKFARPYVGKARRGCANVTARKTKKERP